MPILINRAQGSTTKVNNIILRDKNLNLKERGLLITLMSLPNNWNLSCRGLSKILPEGVDAINSTIKSLIEKGYLEKEQKPGIWETWIVVHEVPKLKVEKQETNQLCMENPCKENPCKENPCKENPCKENPCKENPCKENPSKDKPREENPKEYNNNLNNILNKTKTKHINHSFSARDDNEEIRAHNHEMLANNLHYDERALTQNPHDFAIYKSLFKVLLDFVSEPPKNVYVRVANKNRLYEEVKNTFLNMTNDQINYAIVRLRDIDLNKIVAFTPYALTVLYNSAQLPVELKPPTKEKSTFCRMQQQDYDFKAIEKALCR